MAGGGLSGVAAALSASRGGAETILIEKYGFLGGMATISLVYPMITFHSRKGEQVIAGIAQEIVDELIKWGGSIGHVRDTIGVAWSVTPFDAEILKLVLLSLLEKSSVKVLLHSMICDVQVEDGKIKDAIVQGKGGKGRVKGDIFIDATGDGDLAALAGARAEMGRQEDGACQPMSFLFRLGNVQVEKIIDYMKKNPEEFHDGTLFDQLEEAPVLGVSGFFSLCRKAYAHGILNFPRDRLLFFTGLRKGEVIVNTSRVCGMNPFDLWEMSAAEIAGRKQMCFIIEFFKKAVPGFSECYLISSAIQIGVRESRRIKGRYYLTADDVLEGRCFDDGIAKGAFAVDIHDPKGDGIISKNIKGDSTYDIPYRCLLPVGLENLLVVGRCISCSHEAFASARVMPTCMAIGQAAGIAAAMAVESGIYPRDIKIEKLRSNLRCQGAIV